MHGFLDAWATPYGRAVRAHAAFQILTLLDHSSVFRITVVRGATLMLVGCHNGMMTCVLIVNAVLWSMPLHPEHFNPRELWKDPFEGTRTGGGRRVPLTLR